MALKIQLKEKVSQTKELVCSAYFSYDSAEDPPIRELMELFGYCTNKGLPMIVGCDANAHHKIWGSTGTNGRGTALLEYLNTTNLEVLNQGSTPTYVTARRQEVLDLTLGSFTLTPWVKQWRVSEEPSLSDHRHILFELNLTPNTQSSGGFENRKPQIGLPL